MKKKLKKRWKISKNDALLKVIFDFLFYLKYSFRSNFFYETKKLLLKETNRLGFYSYIKVEELGNFSFFFNSEEFFKQKANLMFKFGRIGLTKLFEGFFNWIKKDFLRAFYTYFEFSYKYIIYFFKKVNNIFIWKFDKAYDLGLIARIIFYFRAHKLMQGFFSLAIYLITEIIKMFVNIFIISVIKYIARKF